MYYIKCTFRGLVNSYKLRKEDIHLEKKSKSGKDLSRAKEMRQ